MKDKIIINEVLEINSGDILYLRNKIYKLIMHMPSSNEKSIEIASNLFVKPCTLYIKKNPLTDICCDYKIIIRWDNICVTYPIPIEPFPIPIEPVTIETIDIIIIAILEKILECHPAFLKPPIVEFLNRFAKKIGEK